MLEIKNLLHQYAKEMNVRSFNKLRLKHIDTRFNFSNYNFDHCILEKFYFVNLELKNANFYSTDVSKAIFCSSNLSNATFEYSTIIGTVFGTPALINTKFPPNLTKYFVIPACLNDVNFSGTTIIDSCMRECSMDKTNFETARMVNTDVKNASINLARF